MQQPRLVHVLLLALIAGPAAAGGHRGTTNRLPCAATPGPPGQLGWCHSWHGSDRRPSQHRPGRAVDEAGQPRIESHAATTQPPARGRAARRASRLRRDALLWPADRGARGRALPAGVGWPWQPGGWCLLAGGLQQQSQLMRPWPGRRLLDEHSHHYKEGEEVPLMANKVGPFNNPRQAAGTGLHRQRRPWVPASSAAQGCRAAWLSCWRAPARAQHPWRCCIT
jgi:hypothetical protein